MKPPLAQILSLESTYVSQFELFVECLLKMAFLKDVLNVIAMFTLLLYF